MARYDTDFYEKKERKGRFNILLALIAVFALFLSGFFMSAENKSQALFYSSAVQVDAGQMNP